MTEREPAPQLERVRITARSGRPATESRRPSWSAVAERATAEVQATPEASRRERLIRVAKIAGWVALGLLVAAVIAVVSVIKYYEADLPGVAQLKAGYTPPQVTRILARDGTELANLFIEQRTVIPLEDLPAHVKLAFLAAEDAHFYEHEGLNYWRMLGALVVNLRAGKTIQGGSTITQQVIKNILLDSERSYRRKIRETILARRVEQHLTKDEIFSLYLNHIYLGHGRYGIEEAARYYFGKAARELALDEAALLAGLVAAPERYSPRRDADRALSRRRYVLDQMLAKGFITEALFRGAEAQPVRLAPTIETESELAPEVVDYVKRRLEEYAGERARLGGFLVKTSIDPRLQTLARRALRDNLDAYAKRHELLPPYKAKARKLWGERFEGRPKVNRIYVGEVVSVDDKSGAIDVRVGELIGRVSLTHEERYNPKHLVPSEFTEPGAALRVSLLAEPEPQGPPPPLRLELGPQSALVAIDVRTREVRALVGSYEALSGGLDRATQARRQPGSAFKPFVYSYALESRRFTPATVLDLVPEPGKKGEPRQLSVRMAVAKSDNLAAERVLEEIGAANVVAWSQALGIQSTLKPTPSLALGAYEVSPLEITNAFATFASGGQYAPARLITAISTLDETPLSLPEDPPVRRVMQPEVAYLTTSLLASVVEVGTGRRARVLERPVAGKTGTTNRAKDAWFVGYSTELVAGVWVGYDDALPLGNGEAGSSSALPAWIAFMKGAHGSQPATQFPQPESLITVRVDPVTGLLAYPDQENAEEELFLDGTAPSAVAEPDAGADPGDPVEPGTEPAETALARPDEFPRLDSEENEPSGVEPDLAEEPAEPVLVPEDTPPPF